MMKMVVVLAELKCDISRSVGVVIVSRTEKFGPETQGPASIVHHSALVIRRIRLVVVALSHVRGIAAAYAQGLMPGTHR